MAKYRNTFFSFHYADADLASQVRQSGYFKDPEDAGFRNWNDWEEVQRKDERTIQRWINDQLHGATVCVVLIGAETASRPWVHYEIAKSFQEDMGLIGIYTNRMNGLRQRSWHKPRGKNPFEEHSYTQPADAKPEEFLPSRWNRNMLAELIAAVGVNKSSGPFTNYSMGMLDSQPLNALGLAAQAAKGGTDTNRLSDLLGLQPQSNAFNLGLLNEQPRQSPFSLGLLSEQPQANAFSLFSTGMLDNQPQPSPANALAAIAMGTLTTLTLASVVKTYCWEDDNGCEELGTWIHEAYHAAQVRKVARAIYRA